MKPILNIIPSSGCISNTEKTTVMRDSEFFLIHPIQKWNQYFQKIRWSFLPRIIEMKMPLCLSMMIFLEMPIVIRFLSMRPLSRILLLLSKYSSTIYYFFIFTIWLLLISTLHLAIQKMNPKIVEIHSLVEVQEVHSLQEQIQKIRRVLIQIQIETQKYEVTVLIPVRISDSPWI